MNLKAKICVGALAALTSLSVRAATEEDFRCLVTDPSGKKPIALEFRTISDAKVKWIAGYVLYKGSKKAIPIVLGKSEIIDQPPGRPWDFEDTWVEVIGGKITGTYVVSHQGANINNFVYRSEKDGKQFSFMQDLEHMGDQGCEW